MKKFLIFMAIVLGTWLYFNPIKEIGLSKPNMMVYSGIPTSIPIVFHYKSYLPTYQDKLIRDGVELKLTTTISEILIDRMGTIGGIEHIVIGLGHGDDLYSIGSDLEGRIGSYNVYSGSTPKMVAKYNSLKRKGEKVMGIMVPNIKVTKLSF